MAKATYYCLLKTACCLPYSKSSNSRLDNYLYISNVFLRFSAISSTKDWGLITFSHEPRDITYPMKSLVGRMKIT